VVRFLAAPCRSGANATQRLFGGGGASDVNVFVTVYECVSVGVKERNTIFDFDVMQAMAYSRIGILFRGFFNRNILLLRKAYTIYIRPLLKYASSVCSPFFTKYINCIENVQRHFTKRIESISDLLELLAVLDVEPLEQRRIKSDLTMYYKI